MARISRQTATRRDRAGDCLNRGCDVGATSPRMAFYGIAIMLPEKTLESKATLAAPAKSGDCTAKFDQRLYRWVDKL